MPRRSGIALAAAWACACGPHVANGPRGDRAVSYAIVTSGRPSGSGELRVHGDARELHYTFNDRGRGPDIRVELRLDSHGAPSELHATGHGYEHDPIDERLAVQGNELVWSSASEHGRARAGSGYFIAAADSFAELPGLIAAMRAAPEHRVALLPAGEARLEADNPVDVREGDRVLHLHQVAIAGFDFVPQIYWLDDDGEIFAAVAPWISLVRTGHEALVTTLVAADARWTSERAARLARTLVHPPPAAGLAITHARVFDSEKHAVGATDATVIVVGDRIAAVGDPSTPIPAGARVIDAHGATLLPGLWDMHVHVGDNEGLLELASGVTTLRDLGNDIDGLGARIARFDAGSEVGPRVIRAGLIDGPGKFAAPTGLLADNAEQATAAVERYAKLGYPQIKVYSSVAPELVPVIAKAAHARGMRVSGHVPNGMTATEAVLAGYDEIQHIAFLLLPFLLDPGDDTRTPLRYTRVAERAASLDLNGKNVRDELDVLAAHHTVIDPTLVTYETLFVPDGQELPPSLVPFAGRLPAQVERGSHGHNLAASDGKRAVFRASFAAVERVVLLAWQRGIPIVAGTDEGGLTLPRELEIYVALGIPAGDVLSIATLGAARVMGQDRETGSIAAGKHADLVLVDGDPTRDISAIRRARLVVCRGIAYDPVELFAAMGIANRPPG